MFHSTPTLSLSSICHALLFLRQRPLRSFHESVQLHEPGYAKWLRTHAPESLDGSDLAQAQEAFSNWPLLHHGELEYVDTPGGVSQEEAVSVETRPRRLASEAGSTNRGVLAFSSRCKPLQAHVTCRETPASTYDNPFQLYKILL